MNIRFLEEKDYEYIIRVLNDWWGGRPMADMLPRLFFQHFNQTSFVIEKDGFIIGFLVGFMSQSYAKEAYIHFVGVHPEYRKQKIGEVLYNKFFETVKGNNCNIVRSVTSPINKVSIGFHKKMGFILDSSHTIVDGNPIFKDYDGLGQDRVLFVKELC